MAPGPYDVIVGGYLNNVMFPGTTYYDTTNTTTSTNLYGLTNQLYKLAKPGNFTNTIAITGIDQYVETVVITNVSSFAGPINVSDYIKLSIVETDWSVEIISGLRSREKQKELLRENGKNAAVDKSRHVLGRAIDINLYKRNWLWRIWLKKYNSKKDWKNSGVVRISEKYGLLWGGSYHSYHDPVHFEIN